MKPFTYIRATNVNSAVAAVAQSPEVKFLGGGTNLIDLLKMGSEHATQLVDINRVPLTEITEHEGGVRIGSMVRNSDAANHPLIRSTYPVLSQAILAGASPQLRNMATMGGNLLQRTRCYYFYDPTYAHCNKRDPGSGCDALRSYNRIHAILGASDDCIATHPSDMCVALSALGVIVQVQGPKGTRSIPINEFHRLPGNTPNVDTNLQHGEMITAIDLPRMSYGKRSHYLKVRDRQSYAFALVSVAAVADLDEKGTLAKVHLALGGVAHKPWRATKAEQILVGKKPDPELFRSAAEVELKDAKGYHDNAFKIELAKRAIVRSLETVTA